MRFVDAAINGLAKNLTTSGTLFLTAHATLLVADALTGQDAVRTAKAFHERLPLTGLVLTRADGDGRGGAALSMRAVTGKPIKFAGTGEKLDAIAVAGEPKGIRCNAVLPGLMDTPMGRDASRRRPNRALAVPFGRQGTGWDTSTPSPTRWPTCCGIWQPGPRRRRRSTSLRRNSVGTRIPSTRGCGERCRSSA